VIESTIPEIDVAELMERVRAEALRPKKWQPRESAAALPPVAMLPAAPAVWIPGAVKSRKARLDALAQTAREKNEPTSIVPKFLRRFFRKQGGYNRAVVESIVTLTKATDDLTRRVGEMGTCLGQLNSWLLALHEQSDADAAWMKAAAPGVSRITASENELHYLQTDLAAARAALDVVSATVSKRKALEQKVTGLEEQSVGVAERLSAAERQIREFAALKERAEATAEFSVEMRSQLDGLSSGLEQLSGQTEALRVDVQNQLRSELDQVGTHLRNLQGEHDRLGVHVNELKGFVDKHVTDTDAIQRFSDRLVSSTADDVLLIKGELSEHGSLLRQLLAQDGKSAAASKKKDGVSKTTPTALDSFYLNFENRFRGSRDEIKRRAAFYLPFVRQVRAGTSRNPILDLGCGRGEWLELLKEEKLEARGVDLNTAMIAQCKAHSLKVRLGDALEHLRSLRANSLGAITGFHIIEHVGFGELMEFFAQARRVLKPGGVAIFESPNCKNLVVGACNFHIDPTHHHPVFPETAQFMLASHGFEKIRIEYLWPVNDAPFEIIAYKPRKR
jgi:SAM-dependent methyltransferase/predicted  nucleic acid-binding Zn-ribbon protein